MSRQTIALRPTSRLIGHPFGFFVVILGATGLSSVAGSAGLGAWWAIGASAGYSLSSSA
jgi:hypothetical protein